MTIEIPDKLYLQIECRNYKFTLFKELTISKKRINKSDIELIVKKEELKNE
jgi:predicted nucleic-acid-binding Zn-ribbon protein